MMIRYAFVTLLLFFSSIASALQINNLMIRGGGYAEPTPYWAGMPLQAGSIELTGEIVVEPSTVTGLFAPRYLGFGFFGIGSENCAIGPTALVRYTPYQQWYWAFGSEFPWPDPARCIPTFSDPRRDSAQLQARYDLTYSPNFSVTVNLLTAPNVITYQVPRSAAGSMMGEVYYETADQVFQPVLTLQFNEPATSDSLFSLAESKLPQLFPEGGEVVQGIEYRDAIWTAKIYSTGWIIGINAAGQVWYLVAGQTEEVMYAESISAALAAISANY